MGDGPFHQAGSFVLPLRKSCPERGSDLLKGTQQVSTSVRLDPTNPSEKMPLTNPRSSEAKGTGGDIAAEDLRGTHTRKHFPLGLVNLGTGVKECSPPARHTCRAGPQKNIMEED